MIYGDAIILLFLLSFIQATQKNDVHSWILSWIDLPSPNPPTPPIMHVTVKWKKKIHGTPLHLSVLTVFSPAHEQITHLSSI